MTVFVIIFWLWFLASTIILITRTLRRRAGRRARRQATADALRAAAAPATAVPPPPPNVPVPVSTMVGAAEVAEPVVIRPSATGLFTPSRLTVPGRPSVAQLITGMQVPHGLVPLTGSLGDTRIERGECAVFVTTSAPDEVVGRGIADELERLGFRVESTAHDTALAHKGENRLRVRIVRVGPMFNGVASREFPSAPPDSVLVEFSIAD